VVRLNRRLRAQRTNYLKVEVSAREAWLDERERELLATAADIIDRMAGQ
jgi:hypothetical protein